MQWFQSIDTDNDGEIDATDLQKALATGNLHFSLATTAHMIRHVAYSYVRYVLAKRIGRDSQIVPQGHRVVLDIQKMV